MKAFLSIVATSVCAAMATTAAADVVHATWGGGGAIALKDNVQTPFTEESGIVATVAEVPNTAGAVRSPTASQYNVVTVTFFEGVAMADLDLLEGFKDEELPGIEDLPPEIIIRNEEGLIVGIPSSFSYYGIGYNSDLASAEDFSSWKDLTDPKWKGKLSVTRPTYAASYDLTMFAHANGGDETNIEPGIEILTGLVKNALTTYTSLAHINTLMGTGEVVAVPMYSTRIWQLRKQGQTNLNITIPKEGALMLAYASVVPKGSDNREEVLKYLQYMIKPETQVRAATATGSIPTNTKAELPADYIESLGLPFDELLSKMYKPDWKIIVENNEERINLVEQIMANAGN
ncbi:extracellular solute-binding protein [Sulfitobacter pseudonitzschiae]|nr:extracellular solute-binding protein [Pseudosulfitobacter pseudonitzschiae]MBM2293922.1 extracellular solute-binding protein [Pseudosulfitobacter pseudonitzschiae]MBM2298839.1 extracellular solute-binding protein [Pseudosulfitobacter pseudonitzschiae]MBM2303753.1 extracellular solute-binding protein [Pseudosulfitobacter pseudonitzschiae]MBM2313536.1 extracellular solute-binding protein [Pseudosulfitobacter pseudonitzschiae]MBM2318450.1 extracellular solute-binding protein [Pseudosulfitobact